MKKKNLFISSFSALLVACVSLFIAFAVISNRPVTASAETTTQQTSVTSVIVNGDFAWFVLSDCDYTVATKNNGENYDALKTLNLINKIKVDGNYKSTDPSTISKALDPYINLFSKNAKSFTLKIKPTSEIVVEQGCQFPSQDYWINGNADGVIYEVKETVTFKNVNGSWVKVLPETDISDTFSVVVANKTDESQIVTISTTADVSATAGGKWLMDNFTELQNYIMLNGKSVKQINDETDDSSYVYTTPGPAASGTKPYAVPVRVLFVKSGSNSEFRLYIHNNYYATLPEDYTVGMKAGFIRSNTEGTANMVVNTDAKFRLINGSFFPANNEADATINMTTGLKGSATDAKGYYHAYVYTDFFKGNTGIGYHIVEKGKAYNYLANYIYLNGKSVKEINAETDVTDWDWKGDFGANAVKVAVLLYVSADNTTDQPTRLEFRIHENYMNTIDGDITATIKEGAMLYDATDNVIRKVASDVSSDIYYKTYKLTINVEGKEPTVLDAKHTLPLDLANFCPDKAGYTFSGWYTNAELTEEATATAMPASDYAVYGKYNAIEYTATVTLADNTQQTVKYTIENREAKLNEIKAMLGVNDAQYTYTNNLPEVLPLEDKTYTETRTVNEYDVVIGDNDAVKVAYGEKVTKPADPTITQEDGYTVTFDGWYNGETKWNFDNDTVTGNLTLVAKTSKTAIEYTATVILGDNTQKTVKYTIVDREAKLAEIKAMLGVNDAQYTYTNDLPEVLPLEDKTYTETRAVNEYDVVIGDASAVKVAYGSKLTKPATNPTKETTASTVYTFDGWYNGSTKWDFDKDVVTGNVTLTAKFSETARKYTVTITFTGVEKEAVTLQVEYNGSVDFNAYKEDGYDMVIRNGETEITELTVTGDANITVEYKEAKKSGCNLSASGLGAVMLALVAGAVVAIAMNKKKKEL